MGQPHQFKIAPCLTALYLLLVSIAFLCIKCLHITVSFCTVFRIFFEHRKNDVTTMKLNQILAYFNLTY